MLVTWLISSTVVGSLLGATSAGQIPIRGGVIGGVSPAQTTPVKAETLKTVVTTPGALRVVENSGICETTPDVFQASGYGDLTATESIFFWYFAARHNPGTAPLTLWFNGGPGSSSMLGLLQELGPCRITNDSSSVTLNPFSWNNNANMLFIDQPVGTGFSYGNMSVGTSQEAAADVWTFLQIFLKDSRFSNLAANDLAIWTESYGGHYGPTFAAYFLSQNAAITAGTVSGLHLNLKTLGIGDGLTDPITQYAGYIAYAGTNPYQALVPTDYITTANLSWDTPFTGCQARIQSCQSSTGSNSNALCSAAQSFCNSNILTVLIGEYDMYYVPSGVPDPYPPDISSYLASIQSKIGAEVTWQQTNLQVYDNFANTARSPDLELVIDSGVRVLIYDGDADYILNYNGVEAMVMLPPYIHRKAFCTDASYQIASMNTKFSAQFNQQVFAPYKVNGLLAGQFKTAGTFSYVRIYGAGHEVPAYKNGSLEVGQAAFQFFSQTMANQSLSST
ncbi:Carboxypeptidase [Mycena sanguinolenta]|uniref:Carboxypeptidase n=1 Tax=Mycena sanguinolenta TaxID=230812 RepID=A0A8H6XK35_9AGAR|nr:Carboxypeptidase [Mycena sanguinolenta]